MKTLFTSILFLGILVFTGCNLVTMCDPSSVRGNGVEKKETRNVGDFTALDVSGACDVEVVCGAASNVEIAGDENILPLIKTEVKNGTLHIYNERSIHTKAKLRIKVSTPDLAEISSSGASDLHIQGVKNQRLSIDISGAGDVIASGETGELYVDISGAADFKGKDLQAKKVEVNVSGSSDADVFAAEELHANVSGVGDISYYGNPQVVEQNVSGVGSIKKK